MKVKSLSRVRLLATPWTVAYQAPPSMGFSRQEYWSGVPFPSPNGPLLLVFSGISTLFSLVFAPTYITASSVGGFLPFHILFSIYCL